MSNFQKVLDFNTKFGAVIHNVPVPHIFDSNPSLIKLKMDLIREELSELRAAVNDADYIETVDALADLLYVIYGMASGIGFDMDITFSVFYRATVGSIGAVVGSESEVEISNFRKIMAYKKMAGVISTIPILDIFTKNNLLVVGNMTNIDADMAILENFVGLKNYKETIYALTKLLCSVYCMGLDIGMDMDKAFNLVHESNMSKLCSSEKEAIDTVLWYLKEYKENRLPYDSPNYRKSDDGKYWVVFNASSGKILKSINYNVVDLTKLVY